MTVSLSTAYSFFRMGLVTGLVDVPALIAWADRQILALPTPPAELIELALAGRLPHSRLIWMLGAFAGPADYDLALTLLLARAGGLLAEDPTRAPDLIMGLRLLNEEEYFPQAVGQELIALRQTLEEARTGRIPAEAVSRHLRTFLAPYRQRNSLLKQLVPAL